MATEAAANFAISLLKENNNENSVVFSPFSLGTALSVVHLGAGGATKKELTSVLLPGCEDGEVTKHYSGLHNTLEASNGTDITIEVGNKFFVRNEVDLKPEYGEKTAKLFGAAAEKFDFSDASAAADAVNSYCAEKTHNKITQVVTADTFTPDTTAVLCNAVYFKGLWEDPFEKLNTEDGDFHAVIGIRKEKFMYQAEKKVLLNFNDPDVQLIAIPYKNTDFKMWFFLPKEGLPLKTWIAGIDGTKLVALMKEAFHDKCNVKLPRFKIESELPAKQNLEDIGLSKIFTDAADLSGISDTPSKVSDVIHKAIIEVNEEGAEAAAVTGIIAATECAFIGPKTEFFVDRPFVYTLSHHDNILVLGTYH